MARIGYDLAIERISCSGIKALSDFGAQLASAASGTGGRPTAQQLVDFGESLFNFTLGPAIRKIYDRLPGTHVSLQIYSNRPELQALPWEYLQQPGAIPTGPNSLRSVVRIVPTIGVQLPKPLPLNGAVRMLFVYAEPEGQEPVSWVAQSKSIERDFRNPIGDKFKFTMRVIEGTRRALIDALEKESFDVLHFSGHGEVGPDGTGRLLFMDPRSRKEDPVTAAELGTHLRDKDLRLVVLGACNTSAGDVARGFTSVAKTLVESGVPAVVANQFPINNSIAGMFASAFYMELLRSGDVDRATSRGRADLNFAPPVASGAARIEWGIPTVYRHLGAARVFEK